MPKHPPPDDEAVNDGSTAFLRVEDLAAPRGKSEAPIPRRPPAEAAPSAPRKGLQVQLPDDEPPPPPKPKAAAAPAGKKGRRGNWWDASAEKLPEDEEPTQPAADPEPEPAPDDAAGATAFLRTEPAPKPPPRRKQREPEPEPVDNSTQFYRPDDAVLRKDVEKERPRPPPVATAAPTAPWKFVAMVLGIFLVVALLGAAVVYREGLTTKKKPAHHPAAAEKQDASDSEK